MITSRKRLAGLHTSGATTYSLDVLPREAAVALFVRIVGADRADKRSAEVDRIVDLCGMLPLAIRLLASRLAMRPTWTVMDLADELEQAKNHLAEFQAENLSVRASFDLSYGVLSAVEAKLFRRLGLHPTGEIGLAAATALMGTEPGHSQAAMGRLVFHNLVREIGRHRYRLHNLIHEYARERAVAEEPPTERKLVAEWMLDYYLCCSIDAHAALLPHRPIKDHPRERPPVVPDFDTPASAVAWFDLERATLLACGSVATEYDHHSYLWRIPRAMNHYLRLRGNLRDAETLLSRGLTCTAINHDERAVADMTALDAGLRHLLDADTAAIKGFASARERYLLVRDAIAAAEMLNRAGVCHRTTGNHRRALAEHFRALDEFTRLGDEFGQAESHYLIATAHQMIGAFDVALPHHRKAIALCRDIGFSLGEARGLAGIAVINTARGAHEEALWLHRTILETYRAAGDLCGVADTFNSMAVVLGRVGRLAEALASQEEAVLLFREVDDAVGVAHGLLVGGQLLCESGRYEESAAQLRESLAISRSNADRRGTAVAYLALSTTLYRSGRAAEALPMADEALTLYRAIGDFPGNALSSLESARCLLGLGRAGEARERAAEARGIARRHGLTGVEHIGTLGDTDLYVEPPRYGHLIFSGVWRVGGSGAVRLA